MKSKNNGITLIALVITIILLLILAGVTIVQLTGNGLFEKVQLAKKQYENAQKEENETLDDYENVINGYITGNRDTKIPATTKNTMSNTEHFTGEYYFNGKPIYEKTIYISSLPNATTKKYNHNISDVDFIWYDTSKSFIIWENGGILPMPYSHPTNLNSQILLNMVTDTDFGIDTGSIDRHNGKAYITLKYTKTTDKSNGNDTIPETLPIN